MRRSSNRGGEKSREMRVEAKKHGRIKLKVDVAERKDQFVVVGLETMTVHSRQCQFHIFERTK